MQNSIVSVAVMRMIRANEELASKKAGAVKAKKRKAAKKVAKTKKKTAKKKAGPTKAEIKAKEQKIVRAAQQKQVTAMIIAATKEANGEKALTHIVEAVDKFKSDHKAKSEKLSSTAVVDGINAAAKKLAVKTGVKAKAPLDSALRHVSILVMDHFVAVKEREQRLAAKATKKDGKKTKAKPEHVPAAHAAIVAKHATALADAKVDKTAFDKAFAELKADTLVTKAVLDGIAHSYVNGRDSYPSKAKAFSAIETRFNERGYQGSKMGLLEKLNYNIV